MTVNLQLAAEQPLEFVDPLNATAFTTDQDELDALRAAITEHPGDFGSFVASNSGRLPPDLEESIQQSSLPLTFRDAAPLDPRSFPGVTVASTEIHGSGSILFETDSELYIATSKHSLDSSEIPVISVSGTGAVAEQVYYRGAGQEDLILLRVNKDALGPQAHQYRPLAIVDPASVPDFIEETGIQQFPILTTGYLFSPTAEEAWRNTADSGTSFVLSNTTNGPLNQDQPSAFADNRVLLVDEGIVNSAYTSQLGSEEEGSALFATDSTVNSGMSGGPTFLGKSHFSIGIAQARQWLQDPTGFTVSANSITTPYPQALIRHLEELGAPIYRMDQIAVVEEGGRINFSTIAPSSFNSSKV